MNDLIKQVQSIIEVHTKLHGKNIKDFAVVDDVLRKTQYKYNRDTVEDIVKNLLYVG